MPINLKKISPQFIRNQLEVRNAEPYIFSEAEILVSGSARPAAVLISLIKTKNGWELLFIRRTHAEGDHHSGQVAFPGGRMDKADNSAADTALRESHEEIGAKVGTINILGELEYMITISNYKVTPVIGIMQWPQNLTPQPTEVERIFSIPLEWLDNSAHHRIEKRALPNSSQSHPVIFFDDYDGEILWGVTAHIVLNFLETLSAP